MIQHPPRPAALLLAAAIPVMAVLAAAAPAPLGAQTLLSEFRTHADWRTAETAHFVVHYPREAEAWTLPMLARIEAMHEQVAALVGFAPDQRVTVVVADPSNVSNGYAIPLMGGPLTVLWTTPPDPRAGIGEHRGWSELLFVHEYAHLAHLAYPSRNPRERLLWRLMPVRLGPVTRRAPRWAIEGYATFVEGRLTGSGRPHGVMRPAFLRTRALDGRLPTYAGLSAGTGYQDGANAYLVGSAFLEWLAERRGDESLTHVWRRMSARQRRSFDDAFAGVFGGPPQELYGRFTVELMEKALAARDEIAAAGLREGELVQLRRWHTGDPAISPDGSRIAIELFARDAPPRLVVWDVDEEPDEERREEARRRLVERDPLDVPAVEWRPPAKTAVATLRPYAGRHHRLPRFMPDGERLLVVRSEPVGDGTFRPDLFLWDIGSGSLRRVTRGAGIRMADPAPDGRTAAGVRCTWGSCDLVRVDLDDGAVAVLAAGSPDVAYYRPRHSPDGRTVIASVQREGRWRLVAVPAEGGAALVLDPDDGADRYDAEFLPDGRSLVLVSTADGVPNLELLDLETGATRALTRVLGAAAAPAPDPGAGDVYFLNMHSRGWDLRRIHPDSASDAAPPPVSAELWPAARLAPESPPGAFRADPAPASRPYGWGPLRWTWLPAGFRDADGGALHLALVGSDPIGRLTATLQAALGDPEAWNGASLAVTTRRFPTHASLELFGGRQHPSGQRDAIAPMDVDFRNAALTFERTRDLWPHVRGARLGAAAGLLDGFAFDDAARTVVFGEVHTSWRLGGGAGFVAPAFRAHGSAGRTAGESWSRWTASLGVGAGSRRTLVDLRATYGRTSADAPAFERFRLGGTGATLFDPALLSQRIAMPAIPAGLLEGDRALVLRGTLRVGPLHPYVWVASVDEGLDEWHRVIGAERRFHLPAVPELRLPAADFAFGAGYSLDEPFEDKLRAYLSVRLTP